MHGSLNVWASCK